MTEQQIFMDKIMSYGFAQTELNLFLDTHPSDVKALEMHAAVAKKYKELVKEYQDCYGPLTAVDSGNAEHWQWIDGPWPWENC